MEKRSLLDKARVAERLQAERDQSRSSASSDTAPRWRSASRSRASRSAHPSKMELPALREILGRVREADVRIREIKAQLAGEIEVKEMDIQEPTPRAWRPTAIAAIVVIVRRRSSSPSIALHLLAARSRRSTIAARSAAGALPGPLVLAACWCSSAWRSPSSVDASASGRRTCRTKDLRTQEVERRLRGRSMLEQELQMEEVTLHNLLAALELPDLAAVEALVAAEEAHMTNILRLRAQLEGLVGREPGRDAARSCATSRPSRSSRRPAPSRSSGPSPTSRARGSGSRSQSRRRIARSASRATTEAERAGAGRAERRRCRGGRGPRRARRGLDEQLAALQRRARVYDATLKALDTAERATIRTATRYLERHGRATSSG